MSEPVMSNDLKVLFSDFLMKNSGDHINTLGIEVIELKAGHSKLRLPYNDALIGNPDNGAMHGGVFTALLDTCCGGAAASSRERPGLGPTIDLRIDYMRPARAGETVIGEAEVYRKTPYVIFVRGRAYHELDGSDIAHCVATFAIIASDSMDNVKRALEGEGQGSHRE